MKQYRVTTLHPLSLAEHNNGIWLKLLTEDDDMSNFSNANAVISSSGFKIWLLLHTSHELVSITDDWKHAKIIHPTEHCCLQWDRLNTIMMDSIKCSAWHIWMKIVSRGENHGAATFLEQLLVGSISFSWSAFKLDMRPAQIESLWRNSSNIQYWTNSWTRGSQCSKWTARILHADHETTNECSHHATGARASCSIWNSPGSNRR
jgi:hypothetical protein